MKKTAVLTLILAVLLGIVVIGGLSLKSASFRNFLSHKDVKGTSIATQKPQELIINGKKRVKYPQDYTIVLVGDSMTQKMGNSDELKADLVKYYPTKTFEVLNYGFGSTNILSVQDRLEKETFSGRVFRPILDIDFDMIIIESLGHNPLSQFPLETGLQKQTDALDKIVAAIKDNNPRAKIVFLATIAPSKYHYAENQVDLTTEERTKWANERIAYIKNHMTYAGSHNIPLIDVFSKSLNTDGELNLNFVLTTDYIHPSPNGIYLISDEIARYIYGNKLF